MSYPHTAHESSSGRICYRYHPFFNQEVSIVRRFRRVVGNSLVVQLPCSLQIVVPQWMVDPVACGLFTDADQARLPLDVLRQLRALVDAQPLPPDGPASYAEESQVPGGHHASADNSCNPSSDV